jgi:S1-C subfamily serine protease
LPPVPADSPNDWTPERIYQQRRAAVVVIGTLHEDGGMTRGSGVILSSDGIVATAYHVLDKANATARGVMTADGDMHAVLEVVAASRADDVALLRIDGKDLPAAPLSAGDPVGAAVTVISHPGSAFYSLTEGYISRYWAATHFGRLSIKMSVTAEFADGSSGGPIFNDRGEVAGIVSSTDALSNQMVVRIAATSDAIRALIRPYGASLAVDASSEDASPGNAGT